MSNDSSAGNTHTIRMRGRDNRYETYKGSIYDPDKPRINAKSRGIQLRESNERLKALQELDRRREEQLKKEMAALDIRRKQQEEETQRRINLKKVRLAETGPINPRLQVPNSAQARRDDDPSQHRFLALVIGIKTLIVFRVKSLSKSGTGS